MDQTTAEAQDQHQRRHSERNHAAVLVEEHRAWARALALRALRILPPSFDIDDLAQVALIALWRCAEQYRADYQRPGFARPVAFRQFARSPVYFACLMAARRRHYREATHEEIPDGCVDVRQDLELRARRRQLFRIVRDAAARLPTSQRRLIECHFLDERSMHETAKLLGNSDTWAFKQRRSALAALRRDLEERGIHGAADCL